MFFGGANSENSDEMPHIAAFQGLYSWLRLKKKKNNPQGMNYISIWNFSLCSLDMRIETA